MTCVCWVDGQASHGYGTTMPFDETYLLKLSLRQKWGGRPCDHPTLKLTYDLKMMTASWFCLTCGEDIHRASPSCLSSDPNPALAQ